MIAIYVNCNSFDAIRAWKQMFLNNINTLISLSCTSGQLYWEYARGISHEHVLGENSIEMANDLKCYLPTGQDAGWRMPQEQERNL